MIAHAFAPCHITHNLLTGIHLLVDSSCAAGEMLMPDDIRSPDSPELADPMLRPRDTGLATFMRVPYREDPAGIDIGLKANFSP
jgi:hypothetical protein